MPRIYNDFVNTGTDVHIYLWQVEETLDELCGLIDCGQEVLDRISKDITSHKRKVEKLATRALLKSTPYGESELCYHSNGQPYLSGSNEFISISHSGNLVVIAISSEPVGVDVEKQRNISPRHGKSFVNETEMQRFVDDNNSSQEFLRIWTVKEAAYKAAPDKVPVVTGIAVTERLLLNDYIQYRICFPDDSSAICKTYALNDFVLSYCRLEKANS